MSGITSTTALWYTSRSTGIICLVLMTAVMVLGALVNRQGRLPGLPKFAVTGLHRNLSLLSVAFLAIHVITAVADPFVSIGIAAIFVPLASPYRALWIGLGAVSLDLMVALVLTSLARARIGRRTWRAVHWLAYLSWPVALAHGLGASQDLRSGPLLALTAVCTAAVLATAGWRLTAAALAVPRARRVPTLMSAPQDLVRAGHR
jgi:methionine sulfoxide reductase heme-binding subunit